MKTIFKYPLAVQDEQEIMLPAGARVLCVQVQRGVPCLWAVVDPEIGKLSHTIHIRGTGHPVEGIENFEYMGTFQLSGGDFIFHVFHERQKT